MSHNTETSVVSNKGESDDEVEWISPPVYNAGLQTSYDIQARTLFPEDFERIVRKHGAVEFVLDPHNPERVVGLAEPTGFINKCDELSFERFGQGIHALSDIMHTMSSKGLVRLATGQLQRAISVWDRLQTDPLYLYARIERRARNAPETFPSSAMGTGSSVPGPTPAELLSRQRFVGMTARYILQSALVDIGHWSCVLAYLHDVEGLDEREGRFGARERRGKIMAQVKRILDTLQSNLLVDFASALSMLPDVRPYAECVKNYGDYTGAAIGYNWSKYPNMLGILTELNTLRGAFLRFLAQVLGSHDDLENRERYLKDISNAVSKASQSELDALGPDVLNAWGEVEMITDIIMILGTDDEDWVNIRPDARLLEHIRNNARSADVFEAAMINKYTKNAEALKSEDNFKKFWEELRKSSLKNARKPLEKLVFFESPAPTWRHGPGLQAVNTPTGINIEPSTAPKLTKTQRKKARRYQQRLARMAEGAAVDGTSEGKNIAPTTADISTPAAAQVAGPSQAYVVPSAPLEAVPEPIAPRAPKIKTRGVADVSRIEARDVEPVQNITERKSNVPAVYALGKSYNTMERLLVRNEGSMDWHDFERMMVQLHFKVIPTSGSAIVFSPPESANTTPFFMHRPHGSAMEPWKVREVGKRLKKQYDITCKHSDSMISRCIGSFLCLICTVVGL
ncbi:hypothetical protein WOLCODRAFT_136950 [Wolfiporia cocos MD-104 SS10]|uniref:Uncharacterized protein n=1 Tax=Wolfiporia cocos (strain MD-104) TaxID=742152 RepID=A0A2H3JFM5_WOLCO|nr:hypothetical protein WOLCODRAFT_136950 [Wolfiporia cocos MD-104 SS10]